MMKQVYWQFLDEVEGAKEYVECASKCKEKSREMSMMYIDMAKAEIDHAEKLLGAMKKIAADERSEADDGKMNAPDILVDIMNGQLTKARAMLMAFE